jgi:hypothetical protein
MEKMDEKNLQDKKLGLDELEETAGGYPVGPNYPVEHYINVPVTNLCLIPFYQQRNFIGVLLQYDAVIIAGRPVIGMDNLSYVPVRIPKYNYKFGYVVRTQISPLVN